MAAELSPQDLMTDNNMRLGRNHSANSIYDSLKHHDAFEFVQMLIKLTEHLISSSANRSEQSASKCKGFKNFHGLLPEGIHVNVCGCVYE